MSDYAVRPLGDRVLVKPAEKRTESAGGIHIVEDWQPDNAGTVIAIGDGIEARKKAVQRFADRVIEMLEYGMVLGNLRLDGAALDEIRRLRDDYQPEHVCKVGDEVTFGVNAGTELDLGGESYLLVAEADLETILEPVS